ncbi:MAG TPA: dihydroorotate dehydrogenase electron transfer subunit [Thermoanaerobacterales bacterium]|nr:dihydroorotate dehydrogenase electron transfer subunit [Thermoanaerobacterales bacterium]
MHIDTSATVISNKKIIPEHYKMEIYSPQTASSAKPGQFIHIKTSRTTSPLLRRPISIYMRDKKRGIISILYKTVGTGTSLLTEYKPEDTIDIMGPLGNGFPLGDEQNRIALAGGGVGIAPLVFLALEASQLKKQVIFIQGAQCKTTLIETRELKDAGCIVETATDDGSAGFHGFPTELLKKYLEKERIDTVYSCGPTPMLKTIKKISLENKIQTYISLEQKMGCGIGACLGCACRVLVNESQGSTYKRVCADGPIFPAEVVVFDE